MPRLEQIDGHDAVAAQLRREVVNNHYRNMSRTAWVMRNQIGTEDLGKVIAAYPSVLLLDVSKQILPTAHYLMEELGIWSDDLDKWDKIVLKGSCKLEAIASIIHKNNIKIKVKI